MWYLLPEIMQGYSDPPGYRDPETNERQLKLEFETPQFLHSLFANDPLELRYLERVLGVRAVTRDGWILLAPGAAVP